MAEKIIKQELPVFMNRAFLNYAMSVITDRALADVVDGLKPIHRRVLYAMSVLSLWHNKEPQKSAKTVGLTISDFSPHGDSSAYGGLVTLAQTFSMRYPLIHGVGNFGNVDGEPAAAYRYTNCRLSPFGTLMLENIAKEACDMKDNFDSTRQEPVFLPTLFANVLCNGATEGIAVGMASKMVPHNLTEVYNALIACIDKQIKQEPIDTAFLMHYIKGPDFPLGGCVIGNKGIYDYFSTGRGKIIVRCKYEIEAKKDYESIVITEIPHKVNKLKMVERMESLLATQLKEVREVIDETDRSGIRIVIKLKKGVNTQTVIQKLCKYTDFQTSISVNNNLLFNGQPKVASMTEIVETFIEHAKRVVARKIVFDLNKIIDRLNYLNIMLWAISNSDELIPIIKASQSTDDLLDAIKAYAPDITPEQAKIVGGVRIRQLSAGNVSKFNEEVQMLTQQAEAYQAILSDEILLAKEVQKEFLSIKEKFGDNRRTEIMAAEKEIDIEDLMDEEEYILMYTTDHLIKTMSENEFRSTKRGAKGVSSGLNEDDTLKYMLSISNKDTLMFFTSSGRCHTLKAYTLPKMSRTSKGRSINNFLNLEENEIVLNIINVKSNETPRDKYLTFVTRNGLIKKLALTQLSSVRSVTKVMSFREDDILISVNLADEEQDFVICTANGIANRFSLSDVRPTGRTGLGVTGIKFKNEEDHVVDATPVEQNHKMFTITEKGYGKLSDFNSIKKARRGSKGVICQNTSTGKLVSMLSVGERENSINELIIATENGQMIRIPTEEIKESGRSAKGVKLANLESDDIIRAVSLKQSEAQKDE